MGDQGGRIARPRAVLPDPELAAGHTACHFDDFTNGLAAAVSEIERAAGTGALQVFELQPMRLGQVVDVNIIVNTGSVPGFVFVTENPDAVATTRPAEPAASSASRADAARRVRLRDRRLRH